MPTHLPRGRSTLRAAILVAGLVFGLTGSGMVLAGGARAADIAGKQWIEIVAKSIRLHLRVHAANDVLFSPSWRPLADAGWRGAASGQTLALTFRAGRGGKSVRFFLIPWQSMSGTGRPEAPFITVAREALVFGPSHNRTLEPKLFAAIRTAVMDAVDHEGGRRKSSVPAPSLPAPLAVIRAVSRTHYVDYQLGALPKTLARAPLARLAPGRMIRLAPAKAGGARHWIAPAPYVRKKPAKRDPGEQRLASSVDLKVAGRRLDRAKRTLFDKTLSRALASDGKAGTREKLFRVALPDLERMIFRHPGHSGPAHAAGAAAYERARLRLARFLALPRDTAVVVFPDYRPKLTRDSLSDYRPSLAPKIASLTPATLAGLAGLVRVLEGYRAAARQNPGSWQNGHIYLGGNSREYRPSDAELMAFAAGSRIEQVLNGADAGNLKHTLSEAGLTGKTIEFPRFEFRHVDVMGSGRFFYASAPHQIRRKLGN